MIDCLQNNTDGKVPWMPLEEERMGSFAHMPNQVSVPQGIQRVPDIMSLGTPLVFHICCHFRMIHICALSHMLLTNASLFKIINSTMSLEMIDLVEIANNV